MKTLGTKILDTGYHDNHPMLLDIYIFYFFIPEIYIFDGFVLDRRYPPCAQYCVAVAYIFPLGVYFSRN